MAKLKFPEHQAHDKPVIIIELEKEVESLKGRLNIVEEAIKELWSCYQALEKRKPSI